MQPVRCMLTYFYSEEQTQVLNKYKRSGTGKVWLNYKNNNGTYEINGKPLLAYEYIGKWEQNHTGKRRHSQSSCCLDQW